MNTKDLVHFSPTSVGPCEPAARQALAPSYHQLAAPLRVGILRARQSLIDRQQDDGVWLGQRHGNASLPSQLILLLAFRGEEQSTLARQAAETILWQQLQAGGWPAFPGGPADVSVSVQAYFALKLTGLASADDRLSLARTRIRELGGADVADAITWYFLALLGQVDYAHCCGQEEISETFQQGLRLPLAVVRLRRPVREVGLERGVRELLVHKPCDWPRRSEELPSRSPSAWWRWDSWKRTIRSRRSKPDGESAWIDQLRSTPVEALEFEELVWHTIALEAMGFDADDPARVACDARLDALVVVERQEEMAHPQPCMSLALDTTLAVAALRESGLEPDGEVLGAAEEALGVGRLIELATAVELSGYAQALAAFEPTAPLPGDALPPQIHMAGNCCHVANPSTSQLSCPQAARHTVACQTVWRLLELQEADGGWSSKAIADCGLRIAEWKTSSANSILASAPEITGAVLEALAQHGLRRGHEAVERAVAWLRDAQQADGSWTSTTGVRFIHGTSLAVRGLLAVGVEHDDMTVAAGVNWLLAHQQPSGGWGETVPATVNTHLFCSCPATATQTAWALLALLAAGRVEDDTVGRGIQFLLDTQQDDGRWDERQFTMRQTASGAWHRSELHAVTWPLTALSRWAVAAAAAQLDEPGEVRLRLVGEEASE